MNHVNEDLFHAVQTGKAEDVKTALERKGNPNYSYPDGYSLLHWAAQEGFVEIARLLVESGANVNAVDENDMTPLFNAAGGGDFEMVKALIELGSDINRVTSLGSALHTAAAYENTEIVELLLVSGADANIVDEEDQTPLFFAATADDTNLAVLLISYGAKKNVCDSEGKTPLDIVREKKEEALARFEDMAKVLS